MGGNIVLPLKVAHCCRSKAGDENISRYFKRFFEDTMICNMVALYQGWQSQRVEARPYVPVDQSARRSVTAARDLYSRSKPLTQHANGHLRAFHHCLDYFKSHEAIRMLNHGPKILRTYFGALIAQTTYAGL
jgi:hypothetical protein